MDDSTGDLVAPALCTVQDEVDAAWVTAALSAAGLLAEGGRATAVERTPVGTGQMADTLRLAVTYEPAAAGPATLIVKLASTDPTSRATGQLLRAYEIEVRFYQCVAPLVGMRIPRMHYADVDTTTGSFTLLLDDQSPAEQGDDLVGCSPQLADACVRELALLHAPCWERADLAAHDWLNRQSAADFVKAYLGMVWPGFVDRYRERLDAPQLELGEQALALMGAMQELPGPRTVTHGDYRLDNMLFHPGDTRPCVVDWQTAAWGAPAADLAYFLGLSLTPEFRRAHHDELVATYHQALGDQGITGYALDALRRDVAVTSLGGLFMAIGASMSVVQTERGDDMFMTMYHRYALQAQELDALAEAGRLA